MNIIRCSCQGSESVEEYYSKLYPTKLTAVRELAESLSEISRFQEAYALTSHSDLILQPIDNYTPPWCVIVRMPENVLFEVRYRMPDISSPWPGAYVFGEAQGIQDAVKMIVIGMEKTEAGFR